MNDTVKRLMALALNYRDASEDRGMSYENLRSALEAALAEPAVEPIPADEVADHIRGMDTNLREDLCAFSFCDGVRWAQKQHGIGVKK